MITCYPSNHIYFSVVLADANERHNITTNNENLRLAVNVFVKGQYTPSTIQNIKVGRLNSLDITICIKPHLFYKTNAHSVSHNLNRND